MVDRVQREEESGELRSRFATTHWSKVVAAGNQQSAESFSALEWLCERYWPPVYAYLRRKGHAPEEARDLTQAFFAFLIERHTIAKADPARGRFRSFLVASLENFLAVRRRHDAAVKRRVTKPFVAWDDAQAERLYLAVQGHADTPERLFEKRWAFDLLERVTVKLRADFAHLARADLLGKLEGHLRHEQGAVPYEDLSRELRMSTGALRVTVHRLRRHFRGLLLAEMAETGVPAAEFDDEVSHLMEVLSGQVAGTIDLGPLLADPGRLGDYELSEELGRGGMGVVFKARQLSLNRAKARVLYHPGNPHLPELLVWRPTLVARGLCHGPLVGDAAVEPS